MFESVLSPNTHSVAFQTTNSLQSANTKRERTNTSTRTCGTNMQAIRIKSGERRRKGEKNRRRRKHGNRERRWRRYRKTTLRPRPASLAPCKIPPPPQPPTSAPCIQCVCVIHSRVGTLAVQAHGSTTTRTRTWGKCTRLATSQRLRGPLLPHTHA